MPQPSPMAGDQDNGSFELVPADLHPAEAGFHPGDDTEPQEGEYRFPRRTSGENVPRESLAERLRRI